MNTLEKIVLAPYEQSLAVFQGEQCIARTGNASDAPALCKITISHDGEKLGYLVCEKESEELVRLSRILAPLLLGDWERNMRVLRWLENARQIEPELCDWVGIYFKESFLRGNSSTDLILGPFIGEPTDHVRIPLDRGLCGLAIREEKVVNVSDVRKDSRHIACSITTRSELVIPLRDSKGQIIAELDIDSNQLAAFPLNIAEHFTAHAETFAVAWE